MAPAVEILRREGIAVRGPLPADTMFHDAARKTYDCAICMYHDQALIPIKTLAFDDAVNVTLGLPFIRTSPDHGTAFDIAGTGKANPSSLVAALRLAARMAAMQARMSAIDDLPPLREVIRQHALSARKSLGQNFLLDLNLTARIARAAGPLEDATIVEVGPGPGGLTRALLALGARHVIAVERDQRALPALEDISRRYPGRLEIVCADAQHFDPRPLIGGTKAKIVANLPYNIATALLIDWLSIEPWPPWYDMMVLMFQREVAERIVARENDEAYGRLGGARQLARRDQDPVRHFSGRLRAATQGHLFAWCDWCRATRRSRATAGRSNRLPPPRSASGGKCCGKASNRWRSIRPGWPRPPMSIRRGAPRPFRSPALLPWPAN